jgi:hypothetical protein
MKKGTSHRLAPARVDHPKLQAQDGSDFMGELNKYKKAQVRDLRQQWQIHCWWQQ